MQAVILAGGKGSRISELSHLTPKPLIEANGKPLIWYIMKHFETFGVNEFLVLGGYKCQKIKEYFRDYLLHESDATFNLKGRSIDFHDSSTSNWKVTVLDTGLETMTGGRLLRASKYLEKEFFLTYGDGISNVDLIQVKELNRSSHSIATLTAVRPPARFGALQISGNHVTEFEEKPSNDNSWINGGYMYVRKEILQYIDGDHVVLERDVLSKLAKDGELTQFTHSGFWQPVDTLRDLTQLEKYLIHDGSN
jgi:glucose-1-phosphate cytidylyltransferase